MKIRRVFRALIAAGVLVGIASCAGNLYFNVHSTNNLCAPATDCSSGEIRGQIARQ